MSINDILTVFDRKCLLNHCDSFGVPDPDFLMSVLLDHAYELSVSDFALLQICNKLDELISVMGDQV